MRTKSVEISTKVDVWSFGLIISEIFSGKKPWESEASDDAKLIGLLFQNSIFPIPVEINDPDIRNIIEKCTNVMPEDRINIVEAKQLIADCIMQKVSKFELDSEFISKQFYKKQSICKYFIMIREKNEQEIR